MQINAPTGYVEPINRHLLEYISQTCPSEEPNPKKIEKKLMRRRRRIAVQLQKVTSENRRKKLMTEGRDIEKKL